MARRSFFRTTDRFLGATRGFFTPFGIAALLIMGVRLGADESVSWVFGVVNQADRLAEWIAAGLLGGLEVPLAGIGIVDAGWGNLQALRFYEFIDIDSKELIAKYLSLGVELYLDAVFIHLAFAYDEPARMRRYKSQNDSFASAIKRHTTLKFEAFRSYGSGLNIEKIYLPVACFMASVCGAALTGLAVENQIYGIGSGAFRAPPWLGFASALVVITLLLWRFGLPLASFSFQHADRRYRKGRRRHPRRALFIGLVPGFFAIPLLANGLLYGTPLGLWLGLI